MPVVDDGEPAEPWFTEEHDHDSKSLVYNDITNTTYHVLVNQTRKIADERGTKHLILNAANYTGSDEMVVNIIQQYWIYTAFWADY